MPRKKSFIEELKRRKVFKAFNSWGILLIGSFTVMEPVSVALNLGEGIQRAFMALVFLTLPVFLVFSWIFEEGADGELEVTDELDDEAGGARPVSSGTGVGSIVFAVVIVALIGVFVANPGGISTRFTSALTSRFFSGVTVGQLAAPIVEGGYEVGANLRLSFSGPIDATTASSDNIRLVNAEDEAVPATVSVDFDGATVVLDPRTTLAYGSDYAVEVSPSLRGADGKEVWDAARTGPGARLTFRTQPIPADGVHPAAALASDLDPERVPVDGPITLEFDDALDASTLQEGLRLRTAGGDELEFDVSMTPDNREVRIEPTSSLTRGSRYSVVVDTTLRAATGLAATPDTFALRVIPQVRASISRPAATPVPTTGPGQLTLNIIPANAIPFLEVRIGTREVELPISGLEIEEGRSHRITITGVPELSSYSMTVFEETVTPTPGQRLTINAEITLFGSIDLDSEPAGKVYIDGQEVGTTPIYAWPLAVGRHDLEIRPLPEDADSYGTLTREVQVDALDWKVLDTLQLPPAGSPGSESR